MGVIYLMKRNFMFNLSPLKLYLIKKVSKSHQNDYDSQRMLISKPLAFILVIGTTFFSSTLVHARGCTIPKSYYKNVVCTASSSYFLASKDSGEPVALLDKNGKKKFDLFKYQRVLPSQLKAGLLPVQRNNKVGYVNMTGREVVPAVYEPLSGRNWARPASNNRIVVKKNGGYGVITTSNRVVIPFSSSISRLDNYSSGKARMTNAGEDMWVDVNGKTTPLRPVKTALNSPTSHTTNHNNMTSSQNAFENDVHLNSILTSQLRNQKALDSLKALSSDNTALNNNSVSQTDIIANNPPYQIESTQSTSSFDLIARQSNGKWGFDDRNNVNMITYSFDEITPFSEGLAGVKVANNWGFIDKAGQLVINFRFNEEGVIRYNQEYRGKPPFTFVNGKAWVGNLNNGEKLCVDIRGINVNCD